MHLFYDDLKPQQESCPVLSAAKDYERPILGLFSNISQMFGSIWADRFNKLYSHLSNKRGAHAYQFWKIPPSSKKNPPSSFIDFITKVSDIIAEPDDNFSHDYFEL